MTKSINGHLIWHWLNLPEIGILFYLIPAIMTKAKNLIVFHFTLITLCICLYTYYKSRTFGSMWCYISNIAWVLLLIQFIITRKHIKL